MNDAEASKATPALRVKCIAAIFLRFGYQVSLGSRNVRSMCAVASVDAGSVGRTNECCRCDGEVPKRQSSGILYV